MINNEPIDSQPSSFHARAGARQKSHLLSWLFISFIFFFFPTAMIGAGGKFALVFVLTCFIVVFLYRKIRIEKWFQLYVVFFVLSTVSIVASTIVGVISNPVAGVHAASLFRPVYMALLIYFFYAIFVSSDNHKEMMGRMAFWLNVFMLLQLLILLLQAYGMASSLEFLYIQDKARGFDSYMRGTGTLGNPNTLSILAIYVFIFNYFFSGTVRNKVISFLLGAAIVVLSGSRTGFFAFGLALVLLAAFSNARVGYKIFGAAFMAIAASFIYYLVGVYSDYIPYLAEALKVIEDPGRMTDVSSMAARMDNWDYKIRYFDWSPSELKRIFGIGFIEEYRVLDNDYLYVYFRTGLLGVMTYYSIFLFPWFLGAFKGLARSRALFRALTVGILVGVMWSFMFDYFSDFYSTFVLLMFVGFSLGAMSEKATKEMGCEG